MDRDQAVFSGAFSRSDGTAPKEWLARIFRERADAPDVLIDALTR